MEKKYLINYLPSAEQDLTDIIDYIMMDNPATVINILSQFDESISILEYFPNSGSIPKDTRLRTLNYRMLVIEYYLVFYVVIGNTVEIRRVLHGKRKYDFLL